MPAYDFFHETVKAALIKAGWAITHDPLTVPFGDSNLHIDLGAERILAAEKGNEKIAIEVKNFIASSLISEFHTALGQFLNYQFVLEEHDPQRTLYLAIPTDAYKEFFSLDVTQKIIHRYHVKLVIFDPIMEEITAWKS